MTEGTETEHGTSATTLSALLQRISPALYFQQTPAIINHLQRYLQLSWWNLDHLPFRRHSTSYLTVTLPSTGMTLLGWQPSPITGPPSQPVLPQLSQVAIAELPPALPEHSGREAPHLGLLWPRCPPRTQGALSSVATTLSG